MPIDGRVSEVKAVLVWKPDAHFVALVTTAPEGTAGELRLVRADDAPGEVAASQPYFVACRDAKLACCRAQRNDRHHSCPSFGTGRGWQSLSTVISIVRRLMGFFRRTTPLGARDGSEVEMMTGMSASLGSACIAA